MRVWVKRIGIVLLIPVVCFLLVSILLYVPAVQNAVAGKVMGYVEKSTGWCISFERIQLAFPLHLSIRKAIVQEAGGEKLASMERLTVDVRLKPLLHGYLSVKNISLESLNLNSGSLLEGMVILGKAEKVSLRADSVNWKTGWIESNSVIFSDANIELAICDTIPADTTASTPFDLFVGLKKVVLNNVAFALRMPCDSVFFSLQVAEAVLLDGYADLGAERYGASGLRAKMNTLTFATDEEEAAQGFDVEHIQLTDFILASDSLFYDSKGTMYAMIRECSVKERSGLIVQSLTGYVKSDSLSFEIETPFSMVGVQIAQVPPNGEDSESNTLSIWSVQGEGVIHKRDVSLLWSDAPQEFQSFFPDTMITVEVCGSGNMDTLLLQKLEIEAPGAFNVRLSGSGSFLDKDSLRTGKVDCEMHTQSMAFVAEMVSSMLEQRLQIPDSMYIKGCLSVDKGGYVAELTAREGDGSVLISGNYNAKSKSYEVFLTVDSLEPVHFMPDDSLLWLSVSVHAKGRDTDLFLASAQAEFDGRVNEFHYGNTSLSDISFSGSLNDNQLQTEWVSESPSIKAHCTFDGTIKRDTVKGFLILDVDSLDFYGLGLSTSPVSSSFQLFTEFETDLSKTHSLDVTVGNWSLNLENQQVQPKMLTLTFRSNADTTHATVYAGDLHIALAGHSDVETIANQLQLLTKEVGIQFTRDSTVDILSIRPLFPELSFHISAERDNPVYNFLQDFNIYYEKFQLDASLSPKNGLQAKGSLLTLISDTTKIDTIRLNIRQDTVGLLCEGNVIKNRFRNQEPFKLRINGYINTEEADLFATYVDGKGDRGLYLGVFVQLTKGGYEFYFYPDNPVIAYLPFTINEDNFFRFRNLKEMDADIRLKGEVNSLVWIHSGQINESNNVLMVEVNQLDLADLSRKFTSLPALKGLLDLSFMYMPEERSFTIVADGNIDEFYYEGGRVGELLLNATYMPIDKESHQIDFHAFHDMAEIASLSVLYKEGQDDNQMKGVMAIKRLPLQIFNAMIPDQTVRMDGFLHGAFDISGTNNQPMLSGSMKLDNVSAYLAPASSLLFFDDQPFTIINNKLTFDKFKIYTLKEHPLFIDGDIDAKNTSKPAINLRMTASNMPLIDSRKTADNYIYGKLFVNFNSTLTGTLQSMRMRGNLHVLGNSNLTYVMMDSPLDVEDNFDELITFTYFADSLPRRTDMRRTLNQRQGGRGATGTDMLMSITVDPVVRFRINLDEEQSNYIEMRGGGDLSMQYTPESNLRFNGRYTMSDGSIRYTIPVIPLTDFTIKNGSYVDWNGDPLNPFLSIAAYTRVRSSVNQDGRSRQVDFNTGIQLRDILNDVSVQFLLEAPTDAVIQNQLTAMGAEEQSKQAISLLMTGVYLASGGTGTDNIDVGAALNSLLQREINNIIGSLVGDMPFTFDYNTYDGTQGMGRRVDYMVRSYFDFFQDRLGTSLGLRYSNNDPVFGNKFFFDDISLGYRFDTNGAREIKMFRSKEYENLFEGEIDKIGASFAIRKKIKRFPDLFSVRQKEAVITKKEEEDEK